MSKKIMILNGSPRDYGNTVALINEFKKGAEEANHNVEVFNLIKMNINPCLGCFSGGKDKNKPCVQNDDMKKIHRAYIESDVVVLASPVYYWFLSGILMTTFDRLFAVAELDPATKNPKKECALIMCSQYDSFNESLFWYNSMVRHMDWTDKGKVLASGVLKVGDITGNDKLKEAYTLGLNI